MGCRIGVVSKSKDTRFLKAIHNYNGNGNTGGAVVSKSKDTRFLKAIHNLHQVAATFNIVVSKSKDTRFLKAIHNQDDEGIVIKRLFQRAKIQDF